MSKHPSRSLPPRRSSPGRLRARHEEDVIQTTIDGVVRANYPLSLLEVMVICSIDDHGTIAKAQQKIAQLRHQGGENVRVLAFKNQPITKPHALNVALRHTHTEPVPPVHPKHATHP